MRWWGHLKDFSQLRLTIYKVPFTHECILRLGKPGGIALQRAVFSFVQFCFSALATFFNQRIWSLKSVFLQFKPSNLYSAGVFWNCSCFPQKQIERNLFLEAVTLSFYKAFPDDWWVTRIEVRVLKGLCRFEMLSHVKNRFSIESVHFVHFVSKNVVSVSGISAVNLIIERFREIFYFVSVVSHIDMGFIYFITLPFIFFSQLNLA